MKIELPLEQNILDKGCVKLLDYMGDDKRIVDAARVSISGDKVKATTDDRNLIRYLLRHKHTSPFEQVKFQFFVKMPILSARQWIRHRMMSVNEMSARYGVLPEEYYIPETPKFQSSNNKQGSGDEIPEPLSNKIKQLIENHSKHSFELYHSLLGEENNNIFSDLETEELKENGGFARELARAVLPVNTYTQWYHTVDLWNLMHFMRLRLDAHAQFEIRVYAQAIYEMVKKVCPLAVEAFDDYILNATTFSAKEMKVVREMLHESFPPSDKSLEKTLGSKREAQEFLKKIE